jgi:hypothetical protein
MVRLIAMLTFYAMALVPGWMAFKKACEIGSELVEFNAKYSFALETQIRNHFFEVIVLMVIFLILAWIGDYVGQTPEQRAQMKQMLLEQRSREIREQMRPESAQFR